MTFRVTMKTPDVLDDAIIEAITEDAVPDDDLRHDMREAAFEAAERWFKHGEYLTVEVDTDLKTCVVIPCGR